MYVILSVSDELAHHKHLLAVTEDVSHLVCVWRASPRQAPVSCDSRCKSTCLCWSYGGSGEVGWESIADGQWVSTYIQWAEWSVSVSVCVCVCACVQELSVEKESMCQLEVQHHRVNLAFADVKSLVQHGDYKIENYDRVKTYVCRHAPVINRPVPHPSFCLSVSLSVCVSPCSSVCPSLCLSVCLLSCSCD